MCSSAARVELNMSRILDICALQWFTLQLNLTNRHFRGCWIVKVKHFALSRMVYSLSEDIQ